MRRMQWREVLERIDAGGRCLVSTHVHPDPDALCSELAMAAVLEARGCRVEIVNEAPLPERFRFLPGSGRIRALDRVRRSAYATAVIVDCGELDRIGAVRRLIEPETVVINVDHHVTNRGFGGINLLDDRASSTSEILYDLLRRARVPLDPDVAQWLYIGIMTDTGSFRYENTSARTHRIVADLMRFDLPVAELYRRLYEMVPLKDLRRFTRLLAGFSSHLGGRVLCLDLPRSVRERFSEDFDLRDKIFRYLRAVRGAEVLVIFTEESPRKTRVNFRSQGGVDVAAVAASFQGGGHGRASGCLLETDMRTARRRVFAVIRGVLAESESGDGARVGGRVPRRQRR